MGVFKKLLGGDTGLDCEQQEDGSLKCRKFVVSGGRKLATGSEANIKIDNASCDVSFQGRYTMLDDDVEDFEKMAKKMKKACQGGVES